jgi:hypothetical protein
MRFAIIPSNGRDCLYQCLDAVVPQVDRTVVISTPDADGKYPLNPGAVKMRHPGKVGVLRSLVRYNISAWWHLGLVAAAMHAKSNRVATWEVAVLNDDAIIAPNWVEAVAESMRATGSAAGCSGLVEHVLREPGPVGLAGRMVGFAFMLAGEQRLRANEDLHWYFTDDYIDWESRKLGGMAMTRNATVEHLHPNGQLNPELHALIAQDAQTFVDIYGMRPW